MPDEPLEVDLSELTFPADGFTDSDDPWDPTFGPEEGVSLHHIRFRPYTPIPELEEEDDNTNRPPHDDIGDAFTMIADGEWHTKVLTTKNGTNETNEVDYHYWWVQSLNAYYADLYGEFPGVWGVLDVNKFFSRGTFNGDDPYDGENVRVEVSFPTWKGRWEPGVDAFKVINTAWDADSPDFAHLDMVDGWFAPRGFMTLYGGNQVSTNTFLYKRGKTGLWYFRFNSDAAEFTINYRVTQRVVSPAGTKAYGEWGGTRTYRATEVIHPSNNFSVVNGDYVLVNNQSDTDLDLWNTSPPIWPNTFRLNTAGLPHGLYNLRVRGRWQTPPISPYYEVVTTPVRNGLHVHGVNTYRSDNYEQNFEYYTQTEGEGWWQFEHIPYQFEQPTTYMVAPFFLVLTGDTIDVRVAEWSGPDAKVEIDLLALDLVHRVVPGETFDITRFERNPIGNEFQGALPSAMTGDINANQFQGLEPHDAGWIDWDIVAMNNGDVYAMIHEELYAGNVGPPSVWNHYFSLRKYDASSGDWTTISTGIGSTWSEGDRAPRGGVSMAYESESTFLVGWWEWTGEYYTTPDTSYTANKAFKWHVARYSTSGSFTELGSGQTMGLGPSGKGSVEEGWYPIQIEVSPTGTIYVCSVQHDYSAPSFLGAKVFCEKWTGSGWVDTGLPQLSSGGYGDRLTGIESDIGSPIVMTMGRADGNPNYPTVQYAYDWDSAPSGTQDWWDSYRIRTMQYNGSSWQTHDMSTTYLDYWFRDTDTEGGQPYEVFSYQRRAANVAIGYVGGRIYSVITRFGNYYPAWDMYVMAEDFSGWRQCTPKHLMMTAGDNWWFQGDLVEGPDGKPTWVTNDSYGGYYVMKLEDVGTGGYTVVSDVNMPLYGTAHLSVAPRIKVRGNKMYLISLQRVWDASWNNLGVFVFRGTLVENFDRGWKPAPEVSLVRVRFAAQNAEEEEPAP